MKTVNAFGGNKGTRTEFDAVCLYTFFKIALILHSDGPIFSIYPLARQRYTFRVRKLYSSLHFLRIKHKIVKGPNRTYEERQSE